MLLNVLNKIFLNKSTLSRRSKGNLLEGKGELAEENDPLPFKNFFRNGMIKNTAWKPNSL